MTQVLASTSLLIARKPQLQHHGHRTISLPGKQSVTSHCAKTATATALCGETTTDFRGAAKIETDSIPLVSLFIAANRRLQHSKQAALSAFAKAKKQGKISDTQAVRWQQLAAMPHEDFEGKLQDPLIKPSTAGLLGLNKPVQPVPDRALWLWGRLRDFEREGILDHDLNEIVDLMPTTLTAERLRLTSVN